MNKASKYIKLFINIEILFDFRSILFAITRYNDMIYNILPDKSQSYLSSLKSSTLEEFLSNFKNNIQLHDYIKNSNLFLTVKPKLYTLLQIFFIFQNFNCLQLTLFSNEEKYINSLKEINIAEKLNLNTDYKTDILFTNKENISALSENENCDVYLIDNNDNYITNDKIIYINKNKGNIISQIFDENSSELSEFDNIFKNEFFEKWDNKFLNRKFLFQHLWQNKLNISKTTIEGKVINGFKRGSKLLGVPTANIEIKNDKIIKELVNGVYYGEFYFKTNSKNNYNINTSIGYKSVLSIGYNPYFDNTLRSVEVFIIYYSGEDFYDEEVRLDILEYIRPESSFENFAELVTTIGYDIKQYS